MQSQLLPDTQLFAGRYIVTGTVATTPYGYTYTAIDRSTDREVYIQEFFPLPGCHRAPDLNMTIRRDHAPAVAALYKKFTHYVSSLKDNPQKSGTQLLHAFRDHSTAYYVTADDDSAALNGTGAPKRHTSRPLPTAPTQHTKAPERHSHTTSRASEPEAHPRRSASEASYRNAILWYRIVIFLLVCIVLLLVYLCYLSPSPKVKSAHTPQSVITETPAPIPADSL